MSQRLGRGTQYYKELVSWIVINVDSDLLDFQDVRNDIKTVMIADIFMNGDVDRVAGDILNGRREMNSATETGRF